METVKPQIGYAGDLFTPSRKYMQLTGGVNFPEKALFPLSDLLLIHDIVYLRADVVNLREVFKSLSVSDVQLLVREERLAFFKPSVFRDAVRYNDIEKVLVEDLTFEKDWMHDVEFDAKKAVKSVMDGLRPTLISDDFNEFRKEMNSLFYHSERFGTGDVSMNVQIGFEQGIGKVCELWKSGINSINYDWEFKWYLDICETTARAKNQSLSIPLHDPDKSIVDDLHKFRNIPSLSELLAQSETPSVTFMDIVMSVEAYDFRNWLRSLTDTEIDVRDAYTKTVSKLPSKNKWVDWMRFGGIQSISAIAGTVISKDPILGFLIGTGISAIDKLGGAKAIDDVAGKYNPDNWISFIEPK
ncbi:MAG: hypothetical protein EOO16_00245 [Chitinophagaceae bacterium]|nr:MAG: hypothetical protein EOO16_00245 [Chitinophagaceae bacterium]